MLNRGKSAALNAAFVCLLYAMTGSIVYLTFHTQYEPQAKFWLMRIIILFLFAPILAKYVIHFFVAPWYPAVNYFRQKETLKFAPSVSIIIPARNEEQGIEATIRSALKSEYVNAEIIVVNDGSTDATHDIVTRLVTENRSSSVPLRYFAVQNRGKARALNYALQYAQGEIIITVDSDSVMDPQAVGNFVRHFNDESVASVAGHVIIGNSVKPLGLIQQLEYLYGFYFKRADSILNSVYIVGGAAAAYRKEVILKHGGFDESIITEDIELSTRLQYFGYKVRYAADAIVYTEGPSDLMSLCRQRLRWKFGRLQTFYKYRDLFFSLKPHHNKFLTFLIFPIAFFAEILLFFEGLLLTAFYFYTFYTHDFLPLLVVITFLSGVIWWQVLVDTRSRFHLNLLLIAPGAWLIFYLIDIIEYQALIRSIWLIWQKRSPVWQPWVRQGVFESVRMKDRA